MSDHRAVARIPWPRNRRYLVGEDGTIVGPRGHVLVGGVTKDGHRNINVMVDGRNVCTGQHVIVAETFHGPRPAGMDVAHANGDPLDNRPSNLSWKTPRGNHGDRKAHGTWGVRLTAEQVAEIRAQPDVARDELAQRYGVTAGTISHIRTGHTWHHTLPAEDPAC